MMTQKKVTKKALKAELKRLQHVDALLQAIIEKEQHRRLFLQMSLIFVQDPRHGTDEGDREIIMEIMDLIV